MTNAAERTLDSQDALPLLDNGKAKPGLAKAARLPRTKKLLLIPLVMGLIALGGVIGMYFQPPGLQFIFRVTGLEPGGGTDHPLAIASNPKAEPLAQQNTSIKALGRLMPYDDIAFVAPPFGAGDARVAKILVREGQYVDGDEVIAVLDNLHQLTSAVSVAEANLDVAEATVAQTESLVGSSFKDVLAERENAAEVARLALVDHQRITALYQQNLVSATDYEQSALNLSQANKSLAQANAQLSRIAGGEHQTDIQLALARLHLATSDLERAKTELQKAYVRAPKSGTIIRLHVRVGERPGGLGVAALGATEAMQAELEVYQTDIVNVSLGAKVLLTSHALTSPLRGTVSKIGLEVERQNLVGASPAANLDARIIRVVVDLDSESSRVAQALTGLQVTATVEKP